MELAYGTPFLLALGLKKESLSLVWLAGPLSGLIAQPIIGVLSDHSSYRLGKRRPFIIVGSLFVVLSLLSLAYVHTLAEFLASFGMNEQSVSLNPFLRHDSPFKLKIWIAILGFYVFDFAVNAAQASCRNLMIDLAPSDQQSTTNAFGAAMIGIGNLLGYLVGSLDLSTISNSVEMNTAMQMRGLCVIAAIWFTICISLTCFFCKEKPNETSRSHHTWYAPFIKIYQAMKILPGKINDVCHIQFLSWIAWFPFLFYRYWYLLAFLFDAHIQYRLGDLLYPWEWLSENRVTIIAPICWRLDSHRLSRPFSIQRHSITAFTRPN